MTGLSEIAKSGVFVIAEVGCNFEGSLDRAREMIRKAAEAGADAVKFQTFVADRVTTRTAEKFWDIEGCVGGTQYVEFAAMPRLSLEQYRDLKRTADAAGIVFFSTPEDEESADMLEKLDTPLFKISSMNITHLPLLRHVAAKKKPIIIATGASTIDEIRKAVDVIEGAGNRQIGILHCISNYPTRAEDVNLNMMAHIKSVFGEYPVGYSDHTKMDESLGILAGAVSLGARIIEKHFTFDRNRPGYDHEISADYGDLKKIVAAIRAVESALGSSLKAPIRSEDKVRRLGRRSIVARVDIREGAVITDDMISVKRPGSGIEPEHMDIVIGSKALKAIKEDEVISWDSIRRKAA